MQFKELKARVESINFNELRENSDDYFEAVVSTIELPKLNTILKDFFGLPVWPSKQELSLYIKKVIKESGGIGPGQTLYLYSQGNNTIFAMLWPWQDKQHTTIKIVNR